MKARETELIGRLESQQKAARQLFDFYSRFVESTGGDETTVNAIVISDLLVNYYTCLETVFLRISQHFENNLPTEKWHRALLDKMALNLPGIRPAVISSETLGFLLELLRFRHFKRYYFNLDYDWQKIRYLQSVLLRLAPRVEAEISRFKEFLSRL